MEHDIYDECSPLDSQELIARCMGNLDFAERLLGKFQGRLDADISQLEEALRVEDPDSLARIAHRIKGASANVAAHSLQQRAAAIEASARERCMADVPILLRELQAERSRFAECATLTALAVADVGAPDANGP